MRSKLTAYLAALAITLSPIAISANDGPATALKQDSSIFVEQVTAHRSPVASERQVDSIYTPNIELRSIDRLDFPRFYHYTGQLSHSIAIQQGKNNRINVQTLGGGNVTLQRQKGMGLVSDIRLIGRRNAIAVDQQGTDLASNIRVLGGNKVIFHVQRGPGLRSHQEPLFYTGTQREAELILDTPKGRLTKSMTN